jgi:Cof subfamily protein (haloacid dehalogenase superfamily)
MSNAPSPAEANLETSRPIAPNRFRFDLVAFDLDDTLLLPTHQLSPRALQALVGLHERGVRVCLASGRMLVNMLPVAQALPFEPSVVSFNGALAHVALSQEPIFHRPVSAALGARVIDWASERNLHLHFYTGNHLFTNRIDDWKARVYREQTGAILEYESDFSRFRDQEATKLLIVDEPERIEAMLRECREMFAGQLTVTRSRPIYLEFLNHAVDKGRGLCELCKYLQVPMERVAAFGDAYNDTEMLQAAGYAVVMENALEEVKKFGAEICPPNSEDGVAQVLERWLAE